MFVMQFTRLNKFLKDFFRARWFLYLFAAGMLSTSLWIGKQNFDDQTRGLILAAWLYVPVIWLVMSFTLNQCFGPQIGQVWSNEQQNYVFTNHRKWVFMLWIAPLSLPYYTCKTLALRLARQL